MACENKCWQKSAQAAYNETAQAYTADGTTLAILGALATDRGESVKTQTGGFQIRYGGLFRVSADVTSTPGAAGVQTVRLMLENAVMPGAVVQDTTVAGAVMTQHVETVAVIPTCCAIQPVVTVWIGGVAGTVNRVNANIVKLG